MTISEAFTRYDREALLYQGKKDKTRVNYQTALATFLRANPDIPVQLINDQHIALWQQDMAYRGLALSYTASNLGRFRNVIKFCQKKGLSVMNPDLIDLPKVGRKEVKFVYADNIKNMINAVDSPRDKALIILMFSSGARISELLSLNRGSIVDGEARIIGKGDKPGIIHFDPVALRYLHGYLETRRDKLPPLFLSGQSRRLGYRRANQIVQTAAQLAGIEFNVTTHVMRHSFATDLLFNGAHIMEIKEHLRHKDISTTMRYLHVTDEHKKESYKKYHTVLE